MFKQYRVQIIPVARMNGSVLYNGDNVCVIKLLMTHGEFNTRYHQQVVSCCVETIPRKIMALVKFQNLVVG